MIHLDTHAVIWLAAGELDRFAPFVLPMLQERGCAISPMVALELDYLYEIERLKVPGKTILKELVTKIGLAIDGASFAAVAAEAGELKWTRDPFDRLICATARVAGAPLLTKDGIVLANEPSAFWDHEPR